MSLGPVRVVRTRRVPSGDQSKLPTPFFRFVTRRASPPSSESSQTCARGVASAAAVWSAEGSPGGISVLIGVGEGDGEGEGVGVGVALPRCAEGPPSGAGLVERKASERPSGDQRGELEDCGLVVNCRGGRLPSVAANQIWESRRFCLWSTVVTT